MDGPRWDALVLAPPAENFCLLWGTDSWTLRLQDCQVHDGWEGDEKQEHGGE